MKRLIWMTAVIAAAATPGLRPRPAVEDYASRKTVERVSVGADRLSPQQVKKAFASPIEQEYLVVEVGVYPADGGAIAVNPDAFVLRVGSGQLVRPVTPRAIASAVVKEKEPSRTARSDRDIVVYPSVGVVYGSGNDPYGNDPYGPNRRGGGWGTTAGVGVGVGGPSGGPQPAPASPGDRKAMEAELGDKQLPEAETSKPVAGYLYFPVQNVKGKSVAYELEFNGEAGRIRIPLQ